MTKPMLTAAAVFAMIVMIPASMDFPAHAARGRGKTQAANPKTTP